MIQVNFQGAVSESELVSPAPSVSRGPRPTSVPALTIPSTRVSYVLDTSSSLPAAPRQVRRLSHTVDVKLPNTLCVFGNLGIGYTRYPACNKSNMGLHTQSLSARRPLEAVTVMQVALAPQEAGWAIMLCSKQMSMATSKTGQIFR